MWFIKRLRLILLSQRRVHTVRFKLGFWAISTFCLLGTGARADVVNISELTDGIPTVQVLTDTGVDITAQRVIILGL
jgi:hypothetical protein